MAKHVMQILNTYFHYCHFKIAKNDANHSELHLYNKIQAGLKRHL
jgi:hypothetical protein